MLPKARSENLIVQEMAEETLVYDQTSARAHCLNRTAAVVWRLCDGRTTLEEIARRVKQELQVDQTPALVQLALEQLDGTHLLEQPVQKPGRLGRREALLKLAVAAAALPVILTVTAPKASAAASPVARLVTCRSNADCPSGTTCAANGMCVAANGQPVTTSGGNIGGGFS